MTHILFLTDNFLPEVNAPASRTFEHCREWVAAGHEVTVVTCAPNFPTGRVHAGYRNRWRQEETVAGIRVIRVWSYITPNEGFAKRILDYVSYMVTGTIAALGVRGVDVVVGTSPQFFTAVGAWMVAKLKRRPWIFELRDIWPESIRTVGAVRSSRLLDLVEKLELFLYRSSARVVAVTHAFKANLAARGIDPAKIEVVTNGVDLDRFAPQAKDAAVEQALDLQGRFVAGYIGTHGMAHALEALIDAAERLAADARGRDIVILLIGDGACKAELVGQARTRGLANIRFADSVPKEDVARYWSVLDASIIHLRASPLFETVIPSKMFEAMAMGIPIVMGVRGEAAEILSDAHAGVTFTPEDGAALAAALIALREDRAGRERYRSAAIAAAPGFSRPVLAARMLDVIQAVVDDRA